MALFAKTSPLDTAINKRDKILNRIKENDDAILAATGRANALALDDAPDAELSVAENQVRDRVDRGKTLAAAHLDAEAQVLTRQREEDETADQKQRDATAIELHKLIEELAREGDVMVASASRMSGIAARTIPIAPEGGGLKNISDVLVAQIPEAVPLLSRLVREYIASVLRREAPATVKKPDAPFVLAGVAAPIRMDLFALRSVKYIDPDSGKLILIQKFQDGSFPPTYAKIALEQKIAVRLSDPLRKHNHGTVAGHAEELHAFDLDAAMAAKNAGPRLVEPIKQSNPQFVETIGPPKRVSMS